MAQLRLDSPVALVKDDRFVVRSYSPVRTIGGGQVLNPIPQKHKRLKPEINRGLQQLADNDPESIIAYHIEQAGYSGVSFSHLKIMTNLPDKQLEHHLQHLLSQKTLIQTDKETRIFIHQTTFDHVKTKNREHLANYHGANPLKAGMSKGRAKIQISAAIGDSKLFNLALNQMIKDQQIVLEEKTVRLASHQVSLGRDQADIRDGIIKIYHQGGLQPPYFRDVIKELGSPPDHAKDVLMLLVEEGQIIKTKDDLYFHAKAVDELKRKLVEFLKINGEITHPGLKR